jgi:D-3-phosphoglycerate dehydrogenase
LQRHFAKLSPQYEALGVEAILPQINGQMLDADGMRSAMNGVDAVIAGDDVIDASVLEAGKASGLKAVIKWGIGTDSIDKVRAAELKIPVYNTPGVFSEEVADLALSLLLALTRQTFVMHQSVMAGGWRKVEGRTIAGMTAGIIGLGSIGLGIARRMQAFGTHVVGYDVRHVEPTELMPAGLEQIGLSDLYRRSDIILIACNLTAENRHLINRDAFTAMKDGVYIVNVSRGPLIDEAALAAALKNGKVGGAGLDVFEIEPLPSDSPLRALPNCVFTTHSGSNTREAVARINQATTDILFHVLGLKSLTTFTPNRVA